MTRESHSAGERISAEGALCAEGRISARTRWLSAGAKGKFSAGGEGGERQDQAISSLCSPLPPPFCVGGIARCQINYCLCKKTDSVCSA